MYIYTHTIQYPYLCASKCAMLFCSLNLRYVPHVRVTDSLLYKRSHMYNITYINIYKHTYTYLTYITHAYVHKHAHKRNAFWARNVSFIPERHDLNTFSTHKHIIHARTDCVCVSFDTWICRNVTRPCTSALQRDGTHALGLHAQANTCAGVQELEAKLIETSLEECIKTDPGHQQKDSLSEL